MKSTLKRELKGLEIVEGEADSSRCAPRFYINLTVGLSTRGAGQRGLVGRYKSIHWCCACRLIDRGRSVPQSLNCALGTLAEGNYQARLETRTKESSKYASRRVENP